jgi:glycosyltransferase involved in cell wall biosynthesis
MRLALLHYSLPPVIGGVEKVVGLQAAALRSMGHEVETLTRDGAGDLRTFDAVIIHNVLTMPFDLEWTRELREMMRTQPQVRWIQWIHDVAAVNPYYAHLPWQDAEHRMLKEPPPGAVHVAVSETRRQDYARAAGIDPVAIHVIPNGADLAAVLGLTDRIAALELWRRDLVMFHPTRLLRRKNIELGIRVCAALRKRGCDAAYVVTGAPDPHQADGVRYHRELKALAVEMEVADQVLFLGENGALSDDDVRSLYAVADCLFFPSKGEGFGLPLLEAVAHRLPVFCSDLTVHAEVIGSTGHRFQLEAAPDDIAAQLLDWAKTAPETHGRRQVWRRHDMVKICQERLEPLLRFG